MSEDKTLKMAIDTKLFHVDSIVNACHKFLPKYYVKLEYAADSDRMVTVELTSRGETLPAEVETEFRDEVLNFAMMRKVLKGTSKIRDQIYHIVFNPERLEALTDQLETELELKEGAESVKLSSKLEKLLQEIESEESPDYQDDPLGICVPWEEKYGKPVDMLHPVEQLRNQAENDLINTDERVIKDVIDTKA